MWKFEIARSARESLGASTCKLLVREQGQVEQPTMLKSQFAYLDRTDDVLGKRSLQEAGT